MPRFRFTVRWMMVAVAIIGVLAAGLIESERRTRRDMHLGLASYYASVEAENLGDAAEATGRTLCESGGCTWVSEAEVRVYHLRIATHSGELKAKHEHAARDPWLPVEPDLPTPE